MNAKIKVICPYCGTENVAISNGEKSSCILTCDNENGGCENDFVVYIDVKITSKTAVIVDKSFTEDAIGGHYATKQH